ncbi:MAG: hypothetical protein JXQ79_03225 [Rhodobacteraceae bacterium]|nr:hypothetical protein [Paracoccaceae bacterium]
MRQPTPESEYRAWYNAWLAGEDPAIHEGQPQVGYFKVRKWAKGPWLPVSIWLEQVCDEETGELVEPERLRCIIGGEEKDPAQVWTFIKPITPEEYAELCEPRPTPAKVAYAWHRAYLAGEKPTRRKTDPQCGWYQTKIVPGGPWVPARIWIEREIDIETGLLAAPEVLICEVDADRVDPVEAWPNLIPISKDDYDRLCHRVLSIAGMQNTTRHVDLVAQPILPL